MVHDDPADAKTLPTLAAQLYDASIDELVARIERLKAEIAQCEQAIESKRAQRNVADSVFGARS